MVPADLWHNAQAEAEAQASGEDSIAFSQADEIDEAYRPTPLHTPLAEDGLPDHGREKVGGLAVPFQPETLVCLADARPGKERQQCRFYKRQVFANHKQPDPSASLHTTVHRICIARRSNGGAFMSLSDEAVYACDLREPADPRTSGYQDEVDRIKIEKKRHLTMIPYPPGSGEEYRLDVDPYEDVWAQIIQRQKDDP